MHFCPKKTQSGFTLTEVMIALLLGTLLMSSVMVIFVYQRRTMYKQTMINAMQLDTRAAFNAIARDVRMAGYGLTDEESIDVQWINSYMGLSSTLTQNPQILDGGTGPDQLICVAAYDPPQAESNGPITSTLIPYNSTGSGAASFNTGNRSVIIIGGTETAHITGLAGGVMTVTSRHDRQKALKYSYKNNTSIELVKAVTYQVFKNGNETYLQRKDNTQTYNAEWESAIAGNIEDFQITRAANGEYTFTVTGRTEEPLPNAPGDGYLRYALSASIYPKNQ